MKSIKFSVDFKREYAQMALDQNYTAADATIAMDAQRPR